MVGVRGLLERFIWEGLAAVVVVEGVDVGGVEFITEAVFEDAVCFGGERVAGDRV